MKLMETLSVFQLEKVLQINLTKKRNIIVKPYKSY